MRVEKLTDQPAQLGEGPCWHQDEQVLYWVDILGKALHRFDPATGENQSWPLPERPGAVVPRHSGGLLLALEHGFAFFNQSNGELVRLPDIESDTRTRFNDGKCDPEGRFWCGSMDLEEKGGLGTLYRMDAEQHVTPQVDGLTVSNGMAWDSKKELMYFIDSPTRRVDCFDFDATDGALHRRRTALNIPEKEGFPDGMTIDNEGKLWIAHWGGSQVCRWDPESGEIIDRISVPSPHVTSCCFGGPDFHTLYITTAREGLNGEALEQHPDAGCLFRIRLEVAGSPTYAFVG